MFKKSMIYMFCMFTVMSVHSHQKNVHPFGGKLTANEYWDIVVSPYMDKWRKPIQRVMMSSDSWDDIKQNIKYNYLNHRGVPYIKPKNVLSRLLQTWRHKKRLEQIHALTEKGIGYVYETCRCGCETLQLKPLEA